MAMYLASVPVYTIMLIGRWSSDAFLCYIRKQVKLFSKHVAKQMLMFDLSEQSQTLHLAWSPKRTSCNATIAKMPR
jgi:hypothetical protein